MVKRELKYSINWQETWNAMRGQRKRGSQISYDSRFPAQFSQDFSNRCKWNDYETGRKAVKILEPVLDPGFSVLEIGPGPGTLTIPLSKSVNKICCIEASERNIKILTDNLNSEGVKNVEPVKTLWERFETESRFDVVVCSHFLWMNEDIEQHLEKMEHYSNQYCIVIQPAGRDELVKTAFERICNEKYTGQFEPDADYFPYTVLRQWSRLVTVAHYDYAFELNPDEGLRYIAGFLGKFTQIDGPCAKKIKDLIISEKGESWTVNNDAVVMWWKVG